MRYNCFIEVPFWLENLLILHLEEHDFAYFDQSLIFLLIDVFLERELELDELVISFAKRGLTTL